MKQPGIWLAEDADGYLNVDGERDYARHFAGEDGRVDELVILEDDDVIIPREVAEVALRELEILIQETGGDAGFDMGDGEEPQAMSPLARVKQLVESEAERLHEANDWGEIGESELRMAIDALMNVLRMIEKVSDESGAEIAPIDPLQDDIFRARNELEEALNDD